MKFLSKILFAGTALLISQSVLAQPGKGAGHGNANAQAKISAHAADHAAKASQKAAHDAAKAADKSTHVAAKASQKAAHDAEKATREHARVNGAVNANAHANENGKIHANENSVLKGEGQVKTKGQVKDDDMDDKIKDGDKINPNKGGTKRHVKGTKKMHDKGIDDDDKTKPGK